MAGVPSFESLHVPAEVESDFEAACAGLAPVEGERVLGRVVQLDRSLPLVCVEGGSYRAEHTAKLVKGSETLAAIGDWVVVDFPEGHENAVISAVLPRRNMLSRPDKGRKGRQQVLAANIDTVFVVLPAPEALASLSHLERQLTMAYQSGADPVVVLSKADKLPEGQLPEVLAAVARSACDVPVIAESAATGEGVEQLASHVERGHVAALLGKSGVGKSSLLNAMLGDDLQRTGEVREKDGKGRHTTISRRMVVLPGGGLLIDSPGLRSFLLTGSRTGVEMAFPDIQELAACCKFRDCRHSGEPGCEVAAAVRSGELTQRRVDSYLSILSEVEHKDHPHARG